MFARVLVANRGEIAVRVLSTLRRLGISGVAVASDVDRDAPHVRAADVTIHIGGTTASESYLSVEKVIDAACRSGAQAIHPGYGFLSESPLFARACADAGVVFIGPPRAAITTMGDKIAAKATAAAAGVPVVPGTHQADMTDRDLVAAAADVGYPLLVKAAAGGGGKGMRAVHEPATLADSLAAARREAMAAFGDDALLLERLVARARHIEIQVLADDHGTVWGLAERECSLQRRHQKVIEESPSPVLHSATRDRMIAAATSVARFCDYRGAGTVEFIVPGATAADADTDFFFLEMNTRLQVEHRVTEAIYGIDLVEWQLRIANGEPLPAEPPRPSGHAMEARVYAEDPTRSFLPTGGAVRAYAEADIEGVRVDSGVGKGSVIGTAYDPMLAKLIAHASSRSVTIDRLRAGLRGFVTLGVTTNTAFLQALLAHDAVRNGDIHAELIEAHLDALLPTASADDMADVVPVVAAMAWMSATRTAMRAGAWDGGAWRHPRGWRLASRAPSILHQRIGDRYHRVVILGEQAGATVTVDDRASVQASASWLALHQLSVIIDGIGMVWQVAGGQSEWVIGRDGHVWYVTETDAVAAEADAGPATTRGPVTAPMPGTVAVLDVAVGDRVTVGQPLVVVEAMKMEHPVVSAVDGVVEAVDVTVGAHVAMDERLLLIAPDGDSRTE